MAKKRSAPAPVAVTPDRAARLYKLLTLLGEGPQTRAGLIRRLGLGVRGFYRDLEVLRSVGIIVDLVKGRYSLTLKPGDALERLPMPDPGLTLGEARLLAKGKTKAHKKLQAQISQVVS